MDRPCKRCGRWYSESTEAAHEFLCPECREAVAASRKGATWDAREERGAKSSPVDELAALREAVERETRSWGIMLLILGAIHQVAGGLLDPGWGVLLIAVGLASFYFRGLAMLPIYGVTMAWAMVSNVGSGQVAWVGFAVVQVYFTYSIFRKFVTLRGAQLRLTAAGGVVGAQLAVAGAPSMGMSDTLISDTPPTVWPDRAAGIFPQAGCALTALAVVGGFALFVAAVVNAVSTETEFDAGSVTPFVSAAVNLAVLGLALGVASLLMGYKPRTANILTVVFGGLALGAVVLVVIVGLIS